MPTVVKFAIFHQKGAAAIDCYKLALKDSSVSKRDADGAA